MTPDTHPATPVTTLDVELLAFDLSGCGRCTGTDRALADAIDAVAPLLRETGTQVRLQRHEVTTAAQAERLRMQISPTIRVNGQDIAPHIEQSACTDCDGGCGCDGGVACRVWSWQGRTYTQAPRGLVIEALLKAYAGRPASPAQPPYQMPENLRRYFAARSAGTAQAGPCCGGADCGCSPQQRSSATLAGCGCG